MHHATVLSSSDWWYTDLRWLRRTRCTGVYLLNLRCCIIPEEFYRYYNNMLHSHDDSIKTTGFEVISSIHLERNLFFKIIKYGKDTFQRIYWIKSDHFRWYEYNPTNSYIHFRDPVARHAYWEPQDQCFVKETFQKSKVCFPKIDRRKKIYYFKKLFDKSSENCILEWKNKQSHL